MGGGKPSKNNLIRIVDNLSLNLRPKNSPEIKGKITKEATKRIEKYYTYLPPRGWIAIPSKQRKIKNNCNKI